MLCFGQRCTDFAFCWLEWSLAFRPFALTATAIVVLSLSVLLAVSPLLSFPLAYDTPVKRLSTCNSCFFLAFFLFLMPPSPLKMYWKWVSRFSAHVWDGQRCGYTIVGDNDRLQKCNDLRGNDTFIFETWIWLYWVVFR